MKTKPVLAAICLVSVVSIQASTFQEETLNGVDLKIINSKKNTQSEVPIGTQLSHKAVIIHSQDALEKTLSRQKINQGTETLTLIQRLNPQVNLENLEEPREIIIPQIINTQGHDLDLGENQQIKITLDLDLKQAVDMQYEEYLLFKEGTQLENGSWFARLDDPISNIHHLVTNDKILERDAIDAINDQLQVVHEIISNELTDSNERTLNEIAEDFNIQAEYYQEFRGGSAASLLPPLESVTAEVKRLQGTVEALESGWIIYAVKSGLYGKKHLREKHKKLFDNIPTPQAKTELRSGRWTFWGVRHSNDGTQTEYTESRSQAIFDKEGVDEHPITLLVDLSR